MSEYTVYTCRNIGVSEYWGVEILGYQNIGMSEYWSVGILGCRNIGMHPIKNMRYNRFCHNSVKWFILSIVKKILKLTNVQI